MEAFYEVRIIEYECGKAALGPDATFGLEPDR